MGNYERALQRANDHSEWNSSLVNSKSKRLKQLGIKAYSGFGFGYLFLLLLFAFVVTVALNGCAVKRWCEQNGFSKYPPGYYSGEVMRRLNEGTEYPFGRGKKLFKE